MNHSLNCTTPSVLRDPKHNKNKRGEHEMSFYTNTSDMYGKEDKYHDT